MVPNILLVKLVSCISIFVWRFRSALGSFNCNKDLVIHDDFRLALAYGQAQFDLADTEADFMSVPGGGDP